MAHQPTPAREVRAQAEQEHLSDSTWPMMLEVLLICLFRARQNNDSFTWMVLPTGVGHLYVPVWLSAVTVLLGFKYVWQLT
jgi:hypothetical protein